MAESVIRLRATVGTDGYGDPYVDWTSPTTTTLTPFGVEPVSSTEDNDGRQAVITGYRLYFLNTWPDVTAADRVQVRGKVWDVVGEPANWQPPATFTTGGLVVELKDVEG